MPPTMTETATPARPDYEAITARQRTVVGQRRLRGRRRPHPDHLGALCDAADLRSGTPRARRRRRQRQHRARRRPLRLPRSSRWTTCPPCSTAPAPARGPRASPIELVEGDAQALPFADASFDAVVSVVGAMFAPDQRRTAAEMLRVCRPGGTIALANWTPEGFVGELFRAVGATCRRRPASTPPLLWGVEDHVRDLFGDGVTDLRARRRTYAFRFDAPERLHRLLPRALRPDGRRLRRPRPDGAARPRRRPHGARAPLRPPRRRRPGRRSRPTYLEMVGGARLTARPARRPAQGAGGRRPVRLSRVRSQTGSSSPPARRRRTPVRVERADPGAREPGRAEARSARAAGSPTSRKA